MRIITSVHCRSITKAHGDTLSRVAAHILGTQLLRVKDTLSEWARLLHTPFHTFKNVSLIALLAIALYPRRPIPYGDLSFLLYTLICIGQLIFLFCIQKSSTVFACSNGRVRVPSDIDIDFRDLFWAYAAKAVRNASEFRLLNWTRSPR